MKSGIGDLRMTMVSMYINFAIRDTYLK